MFDFRQFVDLDMNYGAGQGALKKQGDSMDYADEFSFCLMITPADRVWTDLGWTNHYYNEHGNFLSLGGGFCGVRGLGSDVTDVKNALKELLQNLQWLTEKDYITVKKTILTAFTAFLRYYYYGEEYDVTNQWKYANPLTI